MEAGTDLATTQDLTPEQLEAREAELVQGATAGLDQSEVTLPLVKLMQASSKDVKAEKATAGHFVNSLTGRDYGESAELIITFATKGRLYADKKTGQTHVTFAETAPANWPDKYAGQRFDELGDAEEEWRRKANEDDGDWGSGPPVQTTRNFVGYIPDEGEPGRRIPVRLSLKATSTPAALRIQSIIEWSLKAPWHNVIELSATRESNAADQEYYVVHAAQGRATTTEERIEAVNLAGIIQANAENLRLTGDVDEAAEATAVKREAAAKSDGLDVG